MDLTDIFGPVIHSYTRADMLADGGLVDVSEMAKEAGFRYPVALTRAVWECYVAWDGDSSQDEKGRLWDVLWMAMNAARRASAGAERIPVVLHVVPRGDTWSKAKKVTLDAHCGPGDDAEPVVTIMLPGED